MLMALYFAFKPYFNGFDINEEKLSLIFKSINNMMIFIGLGISFSTLQDTSKTSLKAEKKIWEDPKAGKRFIMLISLMTICTLVFGLFGYFITNNEYIKEVSLGALVLSIGFIGFLKAAIEVFENHRKDKKMPTNTA